MKCVQLQWDKGLIVIHAKHRIEFAFDRPVKNRVRRNGTNEDKWQVTSDYFSKIGCFAVSFFARISSIFGSMATARLIASLVAS